MKPVIINESSKPVPRKYLTWWVEKLWQIWRRNSKVSLPKKAKEISLVFVDEKQGKKLNKKFRGKNYATDVLSFSRKGDLAENLGRAKSSEKNRANRPPIAEDFFWPEELEQISLGELVLCASVVARQAEENGHSFRDESAYLVTHGMLHLLGFDHEFEDRQAKLMFELQDTSFDRLRRLWLA